MFMKSFLFGAVALAAVAPLTAQETEAPAPATVATVANPAADAVVKHVSALLDGSWKSTFAVQVLEGEKKTADVTVGVQFLDIKHFQLDIAMSTEDEFEGAVSQTFMVVADGTFLYVNSPDMAKMTGGMMSGPVKIELAFAEKMISSQANVDINDGGALKGLAAEMIGKMSLKEEGSVEGKRRFIVEQEGVSGFMVFDAKSWFLDSAEFSAEGSLTKISVSDSGKVSEWPEGSFTFTAAEGVVITDLTSMIKAQMGPMEEESDEDLEF